MHLGVNFPPDLPVDDPSAIKDYVQAVEGLGFHFLNIVDHVLGAAISNRPDWSAPRGYTHKSVIREPLVMLGFMAGCTTSIKLGTSVIILPQRQTALVAKQLAEIDVLSRGRTILGVGIGWNPVEYQALNENFRNRGRRLEEQIQVLRLLWTTEVVDFEGEWHRIDRAGINPLPVQKPIPIWIGTGDAEAPMRRAARLADGWLAPTLPYQQMEPIVERFRQYVQEAGRVPSDVAIAPRINLANNAPDEWTAAYATWERLGATHFAINTSGDGVRGVDDHVRGMRSFLQAIGRPG